MKPILIIQFSLNLLSLLSGPATGIQSISQNDGGSVSFYCWSSTEPTVKKCFYRKCCRDCLINYLAKTNNLFENYWLITFAVYYGDSGWYYCGNDNTWVEAFYLKVLQAKGPFVMFGEIGGSIVMSCSNKNKSKTWCHQSQDNLCKKLPLHELDKRIHIVEYTTYLEIRQLKPEDSGNYRCLLNGWDYAVKTIDLQVLQGQNDLSVPLTVNVMPGQPAKIACKYNYKYINENKTWECFNSATNRQCLGNSKQEDDRSRSELVLSINYPSMYDNGNIYTCKVSRLDGPLSSDPVKLMVGLTTPQYVVTHIPGETARIRCNTYLLQYLSSLKSWCKVDFEGTCSNLVSKSALGLGGKITLKDEQSYFEVTIQNLTVSDSGLYRCVYQYWSSQLVTVTADVTLSVGEQQVSPTATDVTRKPTTKYTTMKSKTTMKQEGSNENNNNKNNSLGVPIQSPVLLGIICLLIVIAITLLIMLLKKYRKSSGGENSDRAHNFGEGTFHMNEHRHNNHPININNNYFTHSQEIHDAEDSSSTSSESSDHSFEDIPFNLHPENPKFIANHISTDYQNIKEVSAADDYENMPRDKDQDYVNVIEPENVPEDTEDTQSQALRPTGNRKDSITSSESSTSDESDELSVNYSLVVFKKTTE